MLKITLKYFLVFFIFSIIGVWVSNNYGTVDIFWLGYRVHTSVPMLLVTMWLLFFLIDKCFSIINWIIHPTNPFKKKDNTQQE